MGSKINEVRYINEDDQALLLTGSSDGVLKLFRNYESARGIEVVTAFRALPDLIPSNRNAGLVLDWQQGQGKALVAGDVKVIRVWNAATEVCTNVRSTFFFSFLSHPWILITGFLYRIFPHDPAPVSHH